VTSRASNPLAAVEPRHVGDEAFEHEGAAGLEHCGDVSEALRLALGARKVVESVVDEVDEPEPALDGHVRHVADGDGNRLAAGLRPQLIEHGRGRFDPLDRKPLGGQRQRDPARTDRELEDPSSAASPAGKLTAGAGSSSCPRSYTSAHRSPKNSGSSKVDTHAIEARPGPRTATPRVCEAGRWGTSLPCGSSFFSSSPW
jgi:hypothetical protein